VASLEAPVGEAVAQGVLEQQIKVLQEELDFSLALITAVEAAVLLL
jgi:hypothetical protein